MDLTTKQKRWIIRGLGVVLLVGYVLVLDITKAYLCATHQASRDGLGEATVRDISFDGFWRVTFNTNALAGGPARYSVWPVLPVSFR